MENSKDSRIDITLVDRGKQYGDVEEQARISENIKRDLHCGPTWPQLTPVMQQSLDVIALKLSRIVCGALASEDSWHDIAGYARLGEDDVKRNIE